MSKKPLDLTVLPGTDYGWMMHMIIFERAQKIKCCMKDMGATLVQSLKVISQILK